jgi:glyoxylase-like metal-dependent hydrolase (beta-lactamase superfamily II)
MTASFVPLTPHLWVMHCRAMAYNTGVFISRGQAILIDPGLFAEEFDQIRGLLKARGADPIRLVLTHSHWDHVLGPEQFPGVRVLAQARYAEIVKKYADEIRWGLEHWEKRMGIRRARLFAAPRAGETFDETRVLTVGDLSLRLQHVPGHAADQLALYHAESGTLWASDILSDSEIPYVSDSLAAYQRTLARLSEWDIRVLVPGHGTWTSDPAEIQGRFDHDRAYLAELGERVGAAVKAGRSVDETVITCADMRFRLPEKSQFDHRLNVESVYLELGGQADPKKVGWNKDWKSAPEQWEG